MASTTKVTRVIGTQEYLNTTTGQIEEFQVVEIEERDANFQKIWLGHILSAIDEISNAKMKLLFFLLKEAVKLDNIIPLTTDEISQQSGVSKATVVRTLQILEKHDIVKRKTGVVMLNPNVAFKGGYGKRMNVLMKYYSLPENETGDDTDASQILPSRDG
jgi:predicted transcriptional regulator